MATVDVFIFPKRTRISGMYVCMYERMYIYFLYSKTNSVYSKMPGSLRAHVEIGRTEESIQSRGKKHESIYLYASLPGR